MNSMTFRTLLATAAAAIAACFSQLAIPLAVLVAVMLLDYASGILKAVIARNLSSRIGWQGILKKVAAIAVIGVALVVDYVIGQATVSLGITFGIPYAIGLLVTFWLIINELISILENVSEIGVPLPKFLQTVIKRLKITLEKKAEEQ